MWFSKPKIWQSTSNTCVAGGLKFFFSSIFSLSLFISLLFCMACMLVGSHDESSPARMWGRGGAARPSLVNHERAGVNHGSVSRSDIRSSSWPTCSMTHISNTFPKKDLVKYKCSLCSCHCAVRCAAAAERGRPRHDLPPLLEETRSGCVHARSSKSCRAAGFTRAKTPHMHTAMLASC